MSQEAWIDANVVLRFLTQEPPDLYDRATRIMERVERGELKLHLRHEIVAEVVWVLGAGKYKKSRTEIAQTLADFISDRGILIEDEALVLDALALMARESVPYVDALLALTARGEDQPVATFDDRDFKKLGVKRMPE